jgi:aerobic-type carbon monoxide dehydrogenase small subunit (CoxS/CutS family)
MTTPKIHSLLNINRVAIDVLAPVNATLLDVLRDLIGLCGTKRGCNHGVCGACNVLVDGQVARSCLMLAAEVGERPVTTVEGIAGDRDFSRVQRALIDTGAIQCGFCTPGFVMALTELLQRNAQPTQAEIRTALSGNLCRCSGYVKIVEAAERLAALVDE